MSERVSERARKNERMNERRCTEQRKNDATTAAAHRAHGDSTDGEGVAVKTTPTLVATWRERLVLADPIACVCEASLECGVPELEVLRVVAVVFNLASVSHESARTEFIFEINSASCFLISLLSSRIARPSARSTFRRQGRTRWVAAVHLRFLGCGMS